MSRVIRLGLLIVLTVAVSSASARDRVQVVKVQTWSGQEFSGKLTCNSNGMIEITNRRGEVHSFARDTLQAVWKGSNLGMQFAGLGMIVGFAVGRSGQDDQDKHPDPFRPFSFMMGGTLVFAFIGSWIRVWETSNVRALPTVECDPPQYGGSASLRLGFTLRF